MTAWQPIDENTPCDDRVLWLWWHHEMWLGKYVKYYQDGVPLEFWQCLGHVRPPHHAMGAGLNLTQSHEPFTPTKWHPLPEPPTED